MKQFLVILIILVAFSCAPPDIEQQGINFTTSITGGSNKSLSKSIVYDGSDSSAITSLIIGNCALRVYAYDGANWVVPADHISSNTTRLFYGDGVEFNPDHEYINDIETDNLPANRIDLFYFDNTEFSVKIDGYWYGTHNWGVVPDDLNNFPNPDGTPSGSNLNLSNCRAVDSEGTVETANFKMADVAFVSNTLLTSKVTFIVRSLPLWASDTANNPIYSVYIEEAGATAQYDVFKDNNNMDFENGIYMPVAKVEKSGVTVSTPAFISVIENIDEQIFRLIQGKDEGDYITFLPINPVVFELNDYGYSINTINLAIDISDLVSKVETTSSVPILQELEGVDIGAGNLPLTGNTVGDMRCVAGFQYYVCKATTGTVEEQWEEIPHRLYDRYHNGGHIDKPVYHYVDFTKDLDGSPITWSITVE